MASDKIAFLAKKEKISYDIGMKRGEVIVIILFCFSFITHFFLWGYPPQAVFDEVHFGIFSSNYLTGQFFFDIHPPLAKLLISGFGYIGHVNPSGFFSYIGQSLVGSGYLWLRFLPTLSGTLLPLVIYFLCLELKLSKRASFFAALVIILENSLLVQSRFILTDSLLLLFGFSSLLSYFIGRRQLDASKMIKWFVAAAILAASAVSIKWIGLSFLGLLGLMELYRLWHGVERRKADAWIRSGTTFIILPFLFYYLIFAIHFVLLPNSGSGDVYMSSSFKSEPEPSRFWELNEAMFKADTSYLAPHPYSSAWYTWPLMLRPVYFWNDSSFSTGKEAKIYLLGNPFVYWISLTAVVVALLSFVFRLSFVKKRPRLWLFLLLGYLLNWLPFMLISRQMFLYHYFTALIFGIIILSALIDEIFRPRMQSKLFTALGLIFLISFIWFSPLTYGLPISSKTQNHLFWFETWK